MKAVTTEHGKKREQNKKKQLYSILYGDDLNPC